MAPDNEGQGDVAGLGPDTSPYLVIHAQLYGMHDLSLLLACKTNAGNSNPWPSCLISTIRARVNGCCHYPHHKISQ